MPVYQQTYRRFDGEVQRHGRWLSVLEQELRVLAKSRLFITLTLLCCAQILLRVLQVVAYDKIVQDPNNQLGLMLSNISIIVVDNKMWFDFLRIQSPLVFLLLLFAGSGMICNDRRNNLMEVYFSKPLRWYDYAAGKVFALMLLGLSVTLLPALFFVLLHNVLAPTMITFGESMDLVIGSIAFSLFLVTPAALGVLASSSLLHTDSFAAVAVFMLLIADTVLAEMLMGLLHSQKWVMLSMPAALNRLGEEWFEVARPIFDIPTTGAYIFLVVATSVALLVVLWRARQAEYAK